MENADDKQVSNLGHKGRGDKKAQAKRRRERIKSDPELHKAYLEKKRQYYRASLPKLDSTNGQS